MSNSLYNELSSLGDLYSLDLEFNPISFNDQLIEFKNQWVTYNKSKLWSHRYGLSLLSLDGSMSGQIDLNSVHEWNKANNTSYNELSFRTTTKAYAALTSLSSPLAPLNRYLGRSHLIRLDEGGIFPPHRDNYSSTDNTFRLISFFDCSPSTLQVLLDDQKIHFENNCLYFMNTRKIHSLVSFQKNALMLVINIELCRETVDWVHSNLSEK